MARRFPDGKHHRGLQDRLCSGHEQMLLHGTYHESGFFRSEHSIRFPRRSSDATVEDVHGIRPVSRMQVETIDTLLVSTERFATRGISR